MLRLDRNPSDVAVGRPLVITSASKLLIRWNMNNADLANGNFLTDKMYIELNVLRSPVMYWI
jgi:hypothetical protein